MEVITNAIELEDGLKKEARREKQRLTYSKEFLLKLKTHPKSKLKPKTFDEVDFVSKTGLWDPDHWHSRTVRESKKPPNLNTASTKEEQQDRKQSKEDGDEFCFTPQRRSFVSGCHVAAPKRQEPEPAERASEPAPPLGGGRRVGSGRITARDAEPPAKEARSIRLNQRERTFEGQRNERPERFERNERNERSERGGERGERSFPSRSDPRDKTNDKERRFDRFERDNRGGRYERDRRRNEDDTPEWFLGGPTSQNETIELRGFEEERERGKKSKKEKEKVKKEEVSGSSRPSSQLSEKLNEEKAQSKPSEQDVGSNKKSPAPPMDFNLEEFLKMDTEGLMNGLALGEKEETVRSSKASRWFGKVVEQESEKPKEEPVKEDPARSLLEILQKSQSESKKIVKAEELERGSGKSNSNDLEAFNKLLAQVQEVKPQVVNNAPTEQELLANLLGNKLKMESSQPNQPQEDVLTRFLQQAQQMNQRPPQQEMIGPNGLPGHHHQQMNPVMQQNKQPPPAPQTPTNQAQRQIGSPLQSKVPVSSSSPLAFTPTSVIRKMTAKKDEAKAAAQGKTGGETVSPPAVNPSNANSNRLTGRTASQVQGAARVSNQLGLNEPAVQAIQAQQLQQMQKLQHVQQLHQLQQLQQQQQQLLAGRPLLKGQEALLQLQQQQQTMNRAQVPPGVNLAAAKLLEQKQLLAALQSQQLKQQLLQQQQQRTSPLQQTMMGLPPNLHAQMNRGIPTGVPVGNRTHFRPIHPQPGFAPFAANQAGLQAAQNRLPSAMSNQFHNMMPNMRGQGVNPLAAFQQQQTGNRSPNMMQQQQQQANNPLARWFPPEILSQAAGQMPALPQMANQKIFSLEELERLHASPMSH